MDSRRVFIALLTLLAFSGIGWADSIREKPVLIPQPQRVSFTAESFQINDRTPIIADSLSSSEARYLQSELERLYKIKCSVILDGQPGSSNQIILKTGVKDSSVPDCREGYSLLVDQNRIVLKSAGTAGVFYGIQTMKQLLRPEPSGATVYGCKIYDTPKLPLRGVYLNLRSVNDNAESMTKLKNLFNSLAGLKLNTLYIEIADNMRYDKQEFPLTSSHALTKKQVSDLVEHAKSLHFEVIPYLQLLSHAVWILSNLQNVDILENPSDRSWQTAWCPSNPATVAFEKDILQETMEVFKPNYFHIGIDEVNYGPFRECPQCREKNPSELFYRSIMDAYNILSAMNVKTIMWHDTLLPSGQYMTGTSDKAKGWQIVDRLPKDIIIADWDYGVFGRSSQRQLEYFLNKGFKVTGASFCSAKGIQTFAEGISRVKGSLGLFDTYWYYAGDWSNPKTIAPEAWMSTVITAQYSWNPTSPKLAAIRYDPVYEIAKTLKPVEAANTKWIQIDLNKQFNYCLNASASSWPGYGKGNTLEQVLNRKIVSRRTAFQTSASLTGRNIIVLSAEDNDQLPKGRAVIGINRYATRLAFLISCNVPLDKDALSYWSRATEMPLVGNVSILYSDGSSVEMPLSYRWNIVDWNYKVGVFDGHIAYSGKTKKGNRIQLIRTDWVNPYPDRLIRSIEIRASNSDGMSLAVFAMSCEIGQ